MSIVASSKASYSFLNTPSLKRLKELAKIPFDLTGKNLTPERVAHFISEAAGFQLLYATERVDQEIMVALQELVFETQCLHKMERLQAGEVMNFIEGYPSENRPVLHTAARDFFDAANPAKTAREAAQQAKHELQKLKSFMQAIDSNRNFEELIVVGIGGSDLGPKAHYLGLEHLLKKNRKLHFISNIDPDNVLAVVNQAQLAKSLVLINSKSGTTLETVVNEEFLRKIYKEKGLDPNKHFVSISVPGSPLDDKSKYLECFHLWEWIGGRFSTSSLIGGFVFSFAFGFNVYWEFLEGLHKMDRIALQPEVNVNLPLLGALLGIWNRNFLGYSNVAIVPYCQALGRYAAHIQQLDMESNGKRIDQNGQAAEFETGPIIFGEPGTAAQHSFYQLLHQGTTIVPVEFIGFKENQHSCDFEFQGTTSQEKLLANLFAQSIALATGKKDENPNKVFLGNRPSHILLAKKLTPHALGSLLGYFEHKIAFQGFIWGINSFDQEGVQLGKELANRIIKQMKIKKAKVETETAYPLGDAYLNLLNNIE